MYSTAGAMDKANPRQEMLAMADPQVQTLTPENQTPNPKPQTLNANPKP